MYEKLIDKFFRENAVKNKDVPSVQAIAHFQLTLLLKPDVNEEVHGFINDLVFEKQPNRKDNVLAEKNEIESAANSNDVIHLMRRKIDPMNQHILVNQAVKFEDEVIPETIKRLKTSLNTGFIETAVRVLSACGIDIADELVGYFDEVRDPYAQSMILLVLGFKAKEEHIPWMIEKHKEMKLKYPDETYCDSVIYALDDIEVRIYPGEKELT